MTPLHEAPEAPEAPSRAAAPAPPRRGASEGVLPLFVAVVAGGLLVTGLQLVWLPAPATVINRPAYVVLDTDTLLQAQLQQAFTRGEDRRDVAAEEIAREMQTALTAAFEQYTRQGYAVLHKAAVIAAPPALEVTDAVAAQLGIPAELLDSARHFQQTGEVALPPGAAPAQP